MYLFCPSLYPFSCNYVCSSACWETVFITISRVIQILGSMWEYIWGKIVYKEFSGNHSFWWKEEFKGLQSWPEKCRSATGKDPSRFFPVSSSWPAFFQPQNTTETLIGEQLLQLLVCSYKQNRCSKGDRYPSVGWSSFAKYPCEK